MCLRQRLGPCVNMDVCLCRARRAVGAQVAEFPGIVRGSGRRASGWAAGSAATARGEGPRPEPRAPPRPRGVSAAARGTSAGRCVPGPRAPAPSPPSPLARSQPQIKHFLPLSSYPAGQAARALPLPAPSLPLAVSQSLCSLRRLGGCEAGAPAPSPAMSPPL